MRLCSAQYRTVFRFIGGACHLRLEVFMMNCNLLRSFDQVHRASLIAAKNWRIVGTQRLRPSRDFKKCPRAEIALKNTISLVD